MATREQANTDSTQTLSNKTLSASSLVSSGPVQFLADAGIISGLATVASTASPNIWTNTADVISYTGTATSSSFTPASQAGAKKTLICTGISTFINGPNYLLTGGVDYTTAVGDRIEVVALTTTQFLLSIMPLTPAAGGYLNIPQNSQSAPYTTVSADSGKHILHPTADTTARTFTIAANASVPYAIGTAITFVNQSGAGVVTIAMGGTDTMNLAGAGTLGSRTLAANGIATALKLTATNWLISGTGLT